MIGLDHILSKWARLGVMLNVEPTPKVPDIEMLIVETAEHLPHFARLMPIAVSWMRKYECLVCRHRLADIVRQVKSPITSAALGYMLSTVQDITGSSHFNLAIGKCRKLGKPEPLYDVDRLNEKTVELAKRFSCKEAKHWGFWAQEERLYDDAIRPASWVMQNNPSLQYRALFAGKLQASIIATLSATPGAGKSESALATACNATRKAIRDALDHLELCGLAYRKSNKGLINVRLSKRCSAPLDIILNT